MIFKAKGGFEPVAYTNTLLIINNQTVIRAHKYITVYNILGSDRANLDVCDCC